MDRYDQLQQEKSNQIVARERQQVRTKNPAREQKHSDGPAGPSVPANQPTMHDRRLDIVNALWTNETLKTNQAWKNLKTDGEKT